MKISRFVGIAFISFTALLMGCAASPPPIKPVLGGPGYEVYATEWVRTGRCVELGQMSPEIGALGLGYTKSVVQDFVYTEADFAEAVRVAAATEEMPTAAWCSNRAMAIYTKKRQVDRHNAAVTADQKAWDDSAKRNQIRPSVYCNTIGTQTICQ